MGICYFHYYWINSMLKALYKTELNQLEIPQKKLDITDKKRSNLFQWNGQFSPQFVEALIEEYSNEDDSILDPFLGSGTVLFECSRLKRNGAGSDINPAAYNIARLYQLTTIETNVRKKLIDKLNVEIENIINNFQLIESDNKETTTLFDSIVEQFIILSSNCNEHSSKTIVDAFIVLLDKTTYRNKPDKISKLWSDLSSTLIELPFTKNTINAYNADCRKIPTQDNSIDLVITSPPYINVFNYHQQYRKNTEALGFDVLDAAKSEIGSNRKHRGNRFYTVVQYCLDIAECLVELIRVCKSGSRLIFIVGKESNVRKTPLYNGEIVAATATQIGLPIILRQERQFKNKYGQNIKEEIIHFKVKKTYDADVHSIARKVARLALNEAKNLDLTDDVMADLINAIGKINSIEPSQYYQGN